MGTLTELVIIPDPRFDIEEVRENVVQENVDRENVVREDVDREDVDREDVDREDDDQEDDDQEDDDQEDDDQGARYHRWYGTADLAEPRSFLIAIDDHLPMFPPNLQRLKVYFFVLPTLVKLVKQLEHLRHLHLEKLDVTARPTDPNVFIRLPLLEVLVIERIYEIKKSPNKPNDPPAVTVTFVVNRLATVWFGYSVENTVIKLTDYSTIRRLEFWSTSVFHDHFDRFPAVQTMICSNLENLSPEIVDKLLAANPSLTTLHLFAYGYIIQMTPALPHVKEAEPLLLDHLMKIGTRHKPNIYLEAIPIAFFGQGRALELSKIELHLKYPQPQFTDGKLRSCSFLAFDKELLDLLVRQPQLDLSNLGTILHASHPCAFIREVNFVGGSLIRLIQRSYHYTLLDRLPQVPGAFNDRMAELFANDSEIAERILSWILKFLTQLPHLTSLSFIGSQLSPEFFRRLAELPGLTSSLSKLVVHEGFHEFHVLPDTADFLFEFRNLHYLATNLVDTATGASVLAYRLNCQGYLELTVPEANPPIITVIKKQQNQQQGHTILYDLESIGFFEDEDSIDLPYGDLEAGISRLLPGPVAAA